MSFFSLFLIAVGLSMDAFAVSVCKGLSLTEMKWKYAVLTGLYFGGFQALMPLIGYVLGVQFQDYITSIDHWIAFEHIQADQPQKHKGGSRWWDHLDFDGN